MSTPSISAAAKAAQEGARKGNGRFGYQELKSTQVELTAPPHVTASGYELTAAQNERRLALLEKAQSGSGYQRTAAEGLAGLDRAYDRIAAEYALSNGERRSMGEIEGRLHDVKVGLDPDGPDSRGNRFRQAVEATTLHDDAELVRLARNQREGDSYSMLLEGYSRDHGNDRVRQALAGNPHTSPGALGSIAFQSGPHQATVARLVAANPGLDDRSLQDLAAKTRDNQVRLAIASNPNASHETLNRVALDGGPDVRDAARTNWLARTPRVA